MTIRKRVLAALLTAVLLLSLCSFAALAETGATVTLNSFSGGRVDVTVTEDGNALASLKSAGSISFNFASAYTVSVSATPDDGYTVSKIVIGDYTKPYSDDGAQTLSRSSITATSLSVTVEFKSGSSGGGSGTKYTLTTNAVTGSQLSTTGGSVTAGGSYAAGEVVELSAVAKTGYTFAGWTCSAGSLSSTTDKTTKFTMPAQDCIVSAKFTEATKHTLTLSTSLTGGKICIDASVSNTMTTVTSGSYYPGEVIRLVSQADSGYQLNYWYTSGSGSLTSRYYYATDFVMPDSNVTVSAEFIRTSGGGSGGSGGSEGGGTTPTPAPTPTPSPSEGGEDTPEDPGTAVYIISIDQTEGGSVLCSASTAEAGTSVFLTAIPDDGYTFNGWVSTAGGIFENVNAEETTFTMPAADTTIVATFAKDGGTAPVTPETEDGDEEKDSERSGKGFPWLLVGIGAAAIALIVGIIAVLSDRKRKDRDDQEIDEEYYDDEPNTSLTVSKAKQRKKLFTRRSKGNFDPPEDDEDTDYNDSFFDDF